jgi:hypothetical protein
MFRQLPLPASFVTLVVTNLVPPMETVDGRLGRRAITPSCRSVPANSVAKKACRDRIGSPGDNWACQPIAYSNDKVILSRKMVVAT